MPVDGPAKLILQELVDLLPEEVVLVRIVLEGYQLVDELPGQAWEPDHVSDRRPVAITFPADDDGHSLDDEALSLGEELEGPVGVAVGVDETWDGRKPRGVDDLIGIPLSVPDRTNLVSLDADGTPISTFTALINDGRVPYQKIKFLHSNFTT